MPGTVLGRLVDATQLRQVVRLHYAASGGGAGGQRVVHPQVVFVSTTGRACVDVWQVAGDSSGPLPAWRQLDIRRISRVRVDEGVAFACAPDLNLDSPKYARVLAHCHEADEAP